MQKILLLGGTKFIGRNLVELLKLNDNYELTLFHRGESGEGLFPEIKRIRGDRNTDDILKIGQVEWDYIIDLSCYLPASLESAISALIKPPKNYIFISTCSVYDNENDKSIMRNEEAEILECPPEIRTEETLKGYGNKKAECERILTQSGIQHLILRPALVFGEYDYTDRFYYWLYQVNKHNPILIPDKGARIFSLTYVWDLVQTINLALTKDNLIGCYNVISYPKMSIGRIVEIATQLLKKEPRKVNATPDFLKSEKIGMWASMPLWLNFDHFTYNNQKLLSDFPLEVTPFKKAVKATIDYHDSLGWDYPNYGMSEDRRQSLIELIDNLIGR